MRAGLDLYELPLDRLLNFVYTMAVDDAGAFADRAEVRKAIDQKLAELAAKVEGKEYDTGLSTFIEMFGGRLEDVPVITYEKPPFDPLAFAED
jgi:hypothetical protein